MPTKTSPSRRRSTSRASSKTTRSAAPKRSSSSSRGSSKRGSPPKTSVHQILSPWARDAVGIASVVMGLLAVLAIWFDAGGPVGRALSWLLYGLFGVAALGFPVIGVYWGFVLLRDIAREDRVRMFIGFTMFGLGMLGILSLAGDNPSPFAGWDGGRRTGLAEAAGVFGAIAAYPLSRVVSSIGAGIICSGFVVLGFLVFTGTPVATAWAKARDFFTAADVDDERLEEDDEPDEAASVDPFTTPKVSAWPARIA